VPERSWWYDDRNTAAQRKNPSKRKVRGALAPTRNRGGLIFVVVVVAVAVGVWLFRSGGPFNQQTTTGADSAVQSVRRAEQELRNLPRTTAPSTPTKVALGKAVTLAHPDADGVTRVTVYSLINPVTPSDPYAEVPAGHLLAAADVEVCAGPDGSQSGLSTDAFHLVFPGGTTVDASAIAAQGPNLETVRALGSGQCTRGFVTFEVAIGTAPSAVRYSPNPFATQPGTFDWHL